MEAEQKPAAATTTPHVLIFPCPAQGHVNAMLSLAQLLALQNLLVTFLNTEHIHNFLTRFADLESLPARHPKLQFKTIPDGLPDDHPRSGLNAVDAILSLMSTAKPLLRDVLVSLKPRVTCFIADGLFGGIANEVGEEIGVPVIHFRTIGASCFWAYFCVPNLLDSSELPIRGEEDMDRVITNIPGMENLFRCRDLPSFCRQKHTPSSDTFLEMMVSQTHQTLRARALIINTFEDAEAPALSHMRQHCPNVFTIGPLQAHLNSRRPSASTKILSRSVIYVSFGSITTITRESLMEIWYGLVNSKKRFLWVVRPDMVAGACGGDNQVPADLVEGTKERGFMVGWAPQVEVLDHEAIGGFLTHNGWNSTLESVVAGVPMICWPYVGDQHVNSRIVSEALKVGLDMKDVCNRSVVEKMVNDVLVHRKEEFLESAQAMAALAHKSVNQGGSSYSNLDYLIKFIKSIDQHPRTS